MYTSFRVQNFRCFEDLEMTDLARINLIAGKNNTGKTSLLEAIAINTGLLVPETLKRIHINPHNVSRRNWEVLFYNFNPDLEPCMKGDFRGANIEMKLRAYSTRLHQDLIQKDSDIQRVLQEYDSEQIMLGVMFLGFQRDTDDTLFLFNMKDKDDFYRVGMLKSGVSCNYIPSQSVESLKATAERFSRLQRKMQLDWVIEPLAIIEPRLEELGLLYDGLNGEPPSIHAELEGFDEMIPLSAMGEGMSRIANIMLAIGNAQGGVVLIDEIENGLHYSVQKDVWRAIYEAAKQFDVQIFATTHSYETIQAAHQAFSEMEEYDFRYHRLDRLNDGKIAVATLDQETLGFAIETNFEVR